MGSTRKRSSRTRLGHDKRDTPAFDTVLFHSNLSSLQRKFLSNIPTDKIVWSCELNYQKGLQKYATGCSKTKKENFISGLSRGYFWQPLIAREVQKDCSCQSLSVSHARFTTRPFSALRIALTQLRSLGKSGRSLWWPMRAIGNSHRMNVNSWIFLFCF